MLAEIDPHFGVPSGAPIPSDHPFYRHYSSAKEAGDTTFTRDRSYDLIPSMADRILQPPTAANDNHPLPRVIGLSGPAGSGKSTAAQYLVDHFGYTRIRFAGPLKAMMRAIGLDERQIEGELKEVPSRLLCGRSPRYAMQTVGTEWGRDLIGESFWVGLWEDAALKVLDAGGRVVADDCRFENEVGTLRELGGKIGLLRGRGGLAQPHASEAFTPDPDFVLDNSRSPHDLYFQLATWLRHAA